MVTFTPNKNIPRELPNLAYIEGPNSSGKSTLLNIIALGLLGIKSKKINQVLLNRMRALNYSDYQKIKFNIKITSEDGLLVLSSRKDGFDQDEIVLMEGKEGETPTPIDFDNFERNYNLIYDIPYNPTERLYDLVKELKEEQTRYGNRFWKFGQFLRRLIREIVQYRNPERLEKLKRDLKGYYRTSKNLTCELPALENLLDLLQRYSYTKYFCYYSNECERLELQIDKIEKERQRFKKSAKKAIKKSSRIKEKVTELQDEVFQQVCQVTPQVRDLLPKSEKIHLQIWEETNVFEVGNLELDSRIKSELVHFMNIFRHELERIQNDDSFKNASALGRIIEFLKGYEDSSITIPKIGVTISELVRLLEEENKQNEIMMSNYRSLAQAVDALEILKYDVTQLEGLLKKLKGTTDEGRELTTDYSESYYAKGEQIRSLRTALKSVGRKRDHYSRMCTYKKIDVSQEGLAQKLEQIGRNEELKSFLSLDEQQMEVRISSLEEEITRKRGKLGSLKMLIDTCEKEKEALEKQEPHRYEGRLEELNDLLKVTERISQKLLNDYNVSITKLINRKVEQPRSSEEKAYFKEVSKYLAHRIGSFGHIETTYEAKIVDLVSGFIVTKNDVKIHLSDMGTGQSQSAYLLGLLNVKNDQRKTIALFDEIAMMDDSSLEPVYDRMRRLYRQGRLLLGVVVQRGNDFKVKSLAE